MALRKLGPTMSRGVSLPWTSVRDALDHMAQAAADHVDREHMLVLWESLQVRLDSISCLFCAFFTCFDGAVSSS